MVNHSLTNSVHHACRPPRGCAAEWARAVLDQGSASSLLCHACCGSVDQQRLTPVTAMAVIVVLISGLMPVSMTVTAPAVVTVSATINAALAVAIPGYQVVVAAFVIVAPAAVATAPSPGGRT